MPYAPDLAESSRSRAVCVPSLHHHDARHKHSHFTIHCVVFESKAKAKAKQSKTKQKKKGESTKKTVIVICVSCSLFTIYSLYSLPVPACVQGTRFASRLVLLSCARPASHAPQSPHEHTWAGLRNAGERTTPASLGGMILRVTSASAASEMSRYIHVHVYRFSGLGSGLGLGTTYSIK